MSNEGRRSKICASSMKTFGPFFTISIKLAKGSIYNTEYANLSSQLGWDYKSIYLMIPPKIS